MATPPETVDRPGVSGAQLALVIGGLILLLVVVWFFFLRGGGEEPAAVAPAPLPTTTPIPEPEPTEKPQKPRQGGRVETFQLFAAKDPFEPLITVQTGGGGGGATGPVTEEPTGGEPTDEGPTGGGGGTTNGGGGEHIGGRRVRVVDVFTEDGQNRAQIQVDGTVYTVDEGETFAENFRLLSTSGECATLLFGDDQFTLCEGEEILK